MTDPLTADALDTIEFAAVLDVVAGYAAGALGAGRVRARRPGTDLAWIRRELALVAEVAGLFRRGDLLLAEPVPDLDRTLARLRIAGSVLDGRELAALRLLIAAARRVRDDLVRVRETAPLASALQVEPPPRAAERKLEQSLDPDGNVLDSASPALAAARREVHAARQRLVRRLESVMRSLDPSASAEGAVTIRGDRYVIPVRRDLRHRPSGIIHDESASQGTLFIEPSEAVEYGNALREAEIAEERETLKVLRDLTDLLRPELETLRASLEMCVAVDDLVARARYAVAAKGDMPEVSLAPSPLVIHHGRHPLLLARPDTRNGEGAAPPTTVPFDLELTETERTLLVSGPNTGGKTVLLKAVALFCAMAQSGIIPPVGPGSRLPAFARFGADIGDRQSIAASLSTFSSHVRALGDILEQAADDTLVLLDEVGSGTDPAEGAALAAAALASLTRRGAVTLATTHLGALKTLAGTEPGVVNASLQFDAATLTPTYRFAKGVPGRSYGLAIARRLGLPADVLGDADGRVPDAERGLDTLLASVEERSREIARREQDTAARDVDSEALAARLALQHAAQESRETELRRREKDADRRAREQARAYLLDARAKVEEALGAARAAADDSAAREARRKLEDAIRAEGEALATDPDEPPAIPPSRLANLSLGDAVRTAAGATGEILELRPDGTAVVRMGAMKLVAEASSLVPVAPTALRPLPDRSTTASRPLSDDPASLEVDLRGLTTDEAESATLAALDAAILAEQPYLRIIHGKGTGAVRDRVRQLLGADRRVKSFAFPPPNQGGTGVTIVEFTG